jgi:hypothetical protein
MLEKVGTYTSAAIPRAGRRRSNKGFNIVRFVAFAAVGALGVIFFNSSFLRNISLVVLIASIALIFIVILSK